MNAPSHSDSVAERIGEAAANPGDCIQSVHRSIASAIASLSENGSAALPEVHSQLEEAILLLNLLRAALPRRRPSDNEGLVSQLEQVQASNRLLGELLGNGLTLHSLRLARISTSLGGYNADGHPADLAPPQKLAAIG